MKRARNRPKSILDYPRVWRGIIFISISILFYFVVFSTNSGRDIYDRATSTAKEYLSGSTKISQTAATPAVKEVPQSIYPKSKHLGKLLKNIGYISYFSEEYEIPIWVAYITQYPFRYENAKRPNKFLQDMRVKSPEHSDYTNSGYDRGHMAPAYAISRNYGKQALYETFYLTNIIPQAPKVNREQWRELEQFIANDLSAKYGMVLVFAGPVITEDMPKLKNKVSVPPAMWMVLLVKEGDGTYTAAGFLIPQHPKVKDFKRYLVPIDQIEEASGLDFFSRLSEGAQRKLEAYPGVKVLQ